MMRVEGMTTRFQVFALGFGPPRPLHKMVLRNWAACDSMDFVLLTDCRPEWEGLMAEEERARITVVDTSLDTYFTLAARVLGFAGADDLMASHGDKLFRRRDGWSACGLRGLLRLMYSGRRDRRYTHHGWIDSDVILDPQCVRRHLFRYADRQLLMTTASGMLFEQFKLLHAGVDVVATYKELMRLPFGGMPLEACLVYHLRGRPDITRDLLPPAAIAVHWAYTDEQEDGAGYRKHVMVRDQWQLYDIMQEERLMIAILDSEVKHLPYDDVRMLFHVPAHVMRTSSEWWARSESGLVKSTGANIRALRREKYPELSEADGKRAWGAELEAKFAEVQREMEAASRKLQAGPTDSPSSERETE